MADYYPLLARAVSAQPNASKDARQGIYDRARKALLAQLQSHEPPLSEEEIQREAQALEDAAAQIEMELQPPAPLKKSFDKTQDSEGFAAPARPMSLAERARAHRESLAAGNSPKARAEKKPSAPSAQAGPAGSSARADAKAKAAASALAAPTLKTEPEIRVPEPVVDPRPFSSARRADRSGVASEASAPVVTPTVAINPTLDEAPLVQPDVKSIVFAAEPKTVPTGGLLWKFGRSRAESEALPERTADEVVETTFDARRDHDDLAPAAEVEEPGESAPESRAEPVVRPLAPLVRPERRSGALYWALGALAAVIVVGVGALAFLLKDTPQTVDADRTAPAPVEKPQSKIVDRIGVGPTHMENTGALAGSLETQTSTPASAGTPPPEAASASINAAVAVAQRAALLVQSPSASDAQAIATFVGTVVWRLETVTAAGQPPQLAVRAAIDIPDAHLKASMLLEKNTDPTLPASHTVELRFAADPGSIVGDVKQIDTLQMRKEDSPAGDPLSGLPTTITVNNFLVGLTKGEPAQSRNMDLMRSAGWFDVPMLLGNGKIAKITFETGVSGQKALTEALASWGN